MIEDGCSFPEAVVQSPSMSELKIAVSVSQELSRQVLISELRIVMWL